MKRTKSLGKESLVYVVSNLILSVIPLAFLPLLTRYMTPGEYNQVALFQSLALAYGALLGFSVNGFCNIQYFEKGQSEAEFSDYVTSSVLLLFMSFLFGFFIFIGLYLFSYSFYGVEGIDFLLILVSFFSQYVIYIYLGICQVTHRSTRYALISLSNAFLNISITIFLVVFSEQGYHGRIFSTSFALALVSIVSMFLLVREGYLYFKFDLTLLRKIIKYGVSYLPIILVATTTPLLERIIVTEYFGSELGGFFIVATQLSNGLMLIFNSVAVAYTPYLYRRLSSYNEEDHLLTFFKVEVLWCLIIGIAASLVIMSPLSTQVLSVILPEPYSQSYELILAMVFSSVAKLGFVIWSLYLVFRKMNGLLSSVNLFFSLTYLVILYLFIEELGFDYIGYLSILLKLSLSLVLGGIVYYFFIIKESKNKVF